MAKVVFRKIPQPAPRSAGTVTVTAGGVRRTILSLDTDLETFTDNLTLVFRRNVRNARRENKRVTGHADRVPERP